MKFTKNKVVWLGKQFWPAHVGFCPSKKAWDDFVGAYKVDGAPEYDVPAGIARVYRFEQTGKNTVIMAVLSEDIDGKTDTVALAAVIAHECMHVLQYIMDDIGEDKPGAEIEAHVLQFLVGEFMMAYHKTRKHKFPGLGGIK